MKKSKLNIPILSPLNFRKNHIKNNLDELLNDDSITQFFIHSFKENDISLNLPLPPHKKTVNDFVFITNGSMTRSLGIELFQLKKHDFLFTPENSITTTEFISSDLEGFYCHFSDDFIGTNPIISTFQTQLNRQNYIQVSQEAASNISFLLTRIDQLYKSRKSNPNNCRLIPIYLSTVIADLVLTLKKQATVIPRYNRVFFNFQNLVHKQFKQNLPVKEYAAQLNMTPNHLNKRVKQENGKTASEVIREITMLEAKVLLLQSTMQIKEISRELGFNDDSYFSRLFKIETNYTPSNYRKMIDLS
ncbi:AraC family transcriptional regulator [Bizionia argentinensis JUB59]|uniref:AraC family transcriptional regulator n=1 Tax=Bizionia argentinensis JUB59 TaxID=1046627 RepID=G2EDU9_9FLAO|nr:helix-turn-helix transcriptional regulator [Bizionia argentinensis]EGV43365.1 AraC family transcriptional regulator [Bizionia argentinensis JUB59]